MDRNRSSEDFTVLSPTAVRERIDSAGLNIRARAHALQDGVYRTLCIAIVTGALVHGARIPPERRLAQNFGASRKTVRDALDRLERESFVTRRIGSGTFVSWAGRTPVEETPIVAPSVSPLDAIEARRVIEPNFCDLVVARATEQDFGRMEQKLRDMETAQDQVAFKKAGYAFHLEIARATHNPLLVAIYEVLVTARARAGWGTLIPLNDRKELRDAQIAYNRAIYEALRRRDPLQARWLSEAHLTEMVMTVASFPLDA
jgi:DNA-binding FadR family transcriptional regulator